MRSRRRSAENSVAFSYAPFATPLLAAFAAGVLAALAAVCSTSCSSGGGALKPVAYPDPDSTCPAGRTGWAIEILDRRAQREGSEGVASLIGESIRRSFPGCGWGAEAGASPGRITIEVHRFASIPSGGTWDATAEWSVLAQDPGGRTLTEFEAKEEVSRPDYRGQNNARESMREAFDRAIRRTISGLRVVSSAATLSPGGDAGPRRGQEQDLARFVSH